MLTHAHVAEPGDLVMVQGHRVGQPHRTGEILEVLGPEERPHYRVLWEDGTESVFYPSDDAFVAPRAHAIQSEEDELLNCWAD